MSNLRFHKVNTLPAVLEPSCFYLLKNGTKLKLYLTDSVGAISYSTYDSADIATVCNAYIANLIDQPGGIAGLDLNGKISGLVLPEYSNILAFYSGIVGQASGTTFIPVDNTTPIITEGTQLWSQTLTPVDNNSEFDIEFQGCVSCNTNSISINLALFRDNLFLSSNVATVTGSASTRSANIGIKIKDTPNTNIPITYSCRVGLQASGNTWYFNRGANFTLGGNNKSSWSITER